jgi:hypothetical protein
VRIAAVLWNPAGPAEVGDAAGEVVDGRVGGACFSWPRIVLPGSLDSSAGRDAASTGRSDVHPASGPARSAAATSNAARSRTERARVRVTRPTLRAAIGP